MRAERVGSESVLSKVPRNLPLTVIIIRQSHASHHVSLSRCRSVPAAPQCPRSTGCAASRVAHHGSFGMTRQLLSAFLFLCLTQPIPAIAHYQPLATTSATV